MPTQYSDGIEFRKAHARTRFAPTSLGGSLRARARAAAPPRRAMIAVGVMCVMLQRVASTSSEISVTDIVTLVTGLSYEQDASTS